jgi:hypothetical protein
MLSAKRFVRICMAEVSKASFESGLDLSEGKSRVIGAAVRRKQPSVQERTRDGSRLQFPSVFGRKRERERELRK